MVKFQRPGQHYGTGPEYNVLETNVLCTENFTFYKQNSATKLIKNEKLKRCPTQLSSELTVRTTVPKSGIPFQPSLTKSKAYAMLKISSFH